MHSRLLILLIALALSLPRALNAGASPVYYVAPSGTASLSVNRHAPGALNFAVAHAPQGTTVILEDGAYDGAPNGFTVRSGGVVFQAQHWHGARIINSTGDYLWGPDPNRKPTGDICQGMVFGPCVTPTSGGWSGGGGDGWRYEECEFTHNDGMGFGSHSLVLHCLFTDQWLNSFDVNGATGFTMKNCIARRDNRMNGDSDAIGDKESFSNNLLFDGLVAYDNQGTALWFDTANKDWVVKNCTLFANHGGNNWYSLGVSDGISATQFRGNGQDGAGVAVGAHLMAVTGTAANLHHTTTVTAVTGYNPMTLTVSPVLPAAPAPGDEFAVQPNGLSGGYGLMSEANANGMFINNVTYNNTDGGLFDADSGDGYQVSHAGLIITGNQFDYDGIAFRSITGGTGNPTRKLGSAIISHNRFKMGDKTAQNAFHWGGTNWLEGFPQPHFGLHFDDNTYDPDPGFTGPWAAWYLWAGGATHLFYNAYRLSDLQNPKTFDQDQHSYVGTVAFRGPTVQTDTWPPANDTRWSDVYFPNNTYGPADTIHQVNDDETPYINRAVAGKPVGAIVRLMVFGHTAFEGHGPFTCDVYDYSGRYLSLTLTTAAARRALDAAVPGYAVLRPWVIRVRLTSVDQYHLAGVYSASSRRQL